MAEEMRATVLGCKEDGRGKVVLTGAALGICTKRTHTLQRRHAHTRSNPYIK